MLELSHKDVGANFSAQDFRLRVPRPFIARMRKGDPQDPLLRQVLPVKQELQFMPGFVAQPLEESRFSPVPGLLHKYHGRVLWLFTGACAVNCRYCFRRHFSYEENVVGTNKWPAIIDYISKDKTIEEVILSGGDPLLANDEMLSQCLERIAEIPHVKTLRIHTRLPVVIPARITEKLVKNLTNKPFKAILVVHCNHPDECDSQVQRVMQQCRQGGIIVFNQAVLLAGVNDHQQVQIQLSKRLFECDVLPYYLHLLDPVAGAAHFDVSETKAKVIMKALRKQLPGYLVPKLVREVPGDSGKTAIF